MESIVLGVPQAAFGPAIFVCSPGILVALPFPAVGDEEKALPLVRRTEIAGSQTVRPRFIADSLQVILYKVEPAELNRLLNLLPKDDARPALRDEVEERRP